MATHEAQFKAVMTRIGCARLLLARSKGKQGHALTSRIQGQAITEALGRNPELLPGLSSEDRGKCLALLSQCAFLEGDMAALLKVVAPPRPREKTRLPNQVFFPEVLQYFTATEWATLNGKDIMACLSLFADRMLQLGGRNCSEQCMAKVLSVSLYICSLMKLDELSKSRLLAFFKLEYK